MIIQTITWEDPNIEMEILNEILSYGKNPEILMVSTSCDTALTLLSDERIGNITCVSALSRNLAVLELKMRLLNKVENYQDRINFLDGMLTTDQSLIVYKSFKNDLSCKDFWNNHINIITNGIHLYDKWLKLFHRLKKNNYDLKKTFTYKKMSEVISKSSIDNCLTTPYWKYFHDMFNKHSTDSKESNNNPFYYQMMNFQYPESNLPKYLTNKLSTESLNKIKLINQDFVKYLYATKNKYSLISLGGFMIDCYNKEELYTLFQLLKLRLLPDSRLIIRKFNCDYEIRNLLNDFFVILDRNLIDRTYMYQEIIIARPRRY